MLTAMGGDEGRVSVRSSEQIRMHRSRAQRQRRPLPGAAWVAYTHAHLFPANKSARRAFFSSYDCTMSYLLPAPSLLCLHFARPPSTFISQEITLHTIPHSLFSGFCSSPGIHVYCIIQGRSPAYLVLAMRSSRRKHTSTWLCNSQSKCTVHIRSVTDGKQGPSNQLNMRLCTAQQERRVAESLTAWLA